MSGRAADVGLTSCPTCWLLVDCRATRRCPGCNGRVVLRAPHSIQRTMALVTTAAVLYVPAMVLPITRTVSLGDTTDATIVGGVTALWELGSYPIALVIFFASVVVPIGKLTALTVLCWYATRSAPANPHQQTLLYRVTELVGKWSMIDVFVIAILVALIKLGDVLSFYPGLGALMFSAVVIITMLAAQQFDPRLIWDQAQRAHKGAGDE